MSDPAPSDSQLERHARRRGETEEEMLDRNVNEVLQELRVTQAGVQILFAFLLGLAFTQVFDKITSAERWIYVVTLLLTAASTALLIAPASMHRLLFRRGMRKELVEYANRYAIGGLTLLCGAIVGAVLLILDVVLGTPRAVAITAVLALWFVAFWFVVPMVLRRRSAAQPGHHSGHERTQEGSQGS